MGKIERKIVKIDEDKCDGCGVCVPSCAEGAIEIVDGKARLVAENLCDGIGNCLGTCPKDAITIETETADAFDDNAVDEHLGRVAKEVPAEQSSHASCPGAQLKVLDTKAPAEQSTPASCPSASIASQLGHWPVQLTLLPPAGDIWNDADILLAADCVPVTMPDFHNRLLSGKTIAIACPKLDDTEPYLEKFTRVFADNNIKSITVAHMEVPCCSGLVYIVTQALEKAGRGDIPFTDIMIGIDGTIKEERIVK